MFLSKIMLQGAACRNPYEIHRMLWRLFPENSVAKRDFLFRVVQVEKDRAEVLLQSDRMPENSSEAARILGCKEYKLSLLAGQRLRFLLVANPIKMIKDEKERPGTDGNIKKCRVPLITEEQQRTWLERKLCGAALLESLELDPTLPLRFRKNREERAGKIQPVQFKGVLQVTDAGMLQVLVRSGIGPAKGFGCGLLSLARG